MNSYQYSDNLYFVLNVCEKSSYEEIRKSYRELVLKFHPDKNKNENAGQIFKKIQYAYEILSNKDKKDMYDFERKKNMKWRSGSKTQNLIHEFIINNELILQNIFEFLLSESY
jgi:DnaJ-class molecular chaperone